MESNFIIHLILLFFLAVSCFSVFRDCGKQVYLGKEIMF